MLAEKNSKILLEKLLQEDSVCLEVMGFQISMKMFDHATKLALSTPIYNGGNYIPKSVRNCVSHKAPFALADTRTYLSVDEKKYSVLLNYLGSLASINELSLKQLIENFSWLASEWRTYLEEHGKNDLIHVRVK